MVEAARKVDEENHKQYIEQIQDQIEKHNDKIEEIRAGLSRNGEMIQRAFKRIEEEGSNLYTKLIDTTIFGVPVYARTFRKRGKHLRAKLTSETMGHCPQQEE
jgi:hypothetical protein